METRDEVCQQLLVNYSGIKGEDGKKGKNAKNSLKGN
jgi:hypothetical protein